MEVSKRLTTAINALSAEGIVTERGYPDRNIRVPNLPAAAITVERADGRETVLAVWICGPMAAACEDTAQVAAKALRQKLAFCQVEACRFDEKSGLFSVKIQALWKENLVNTIRLNQDVLAYATEFSAVQTRQVQQVTEEETGEVQAVNEEVIWTIALQEQLPFEEARSVENETPFALTVYRQTHMEIYPDCHWLSITLEENGAGLLCKRIARSWSERVVRSIGE